MANTNELPAKQILVINSGSSSIKFALYRMGQQEERLYHGILENIGLPWGHFALNDGNGNLLQVEDKELPDHQAAMEVLLEWLNQADLPGQTDAVGHRVVHGGQDYHEPLLVDDGVMDTLEALVPLAPEHMQQEVNAIEAVEQALPGTQQVACFDTAFHAHLPGVAQRFALPRTYYSQGVRRYGFHGLSYEYIMQDFRREVGQQEADERIIIAHLGNGASMAAVHHGKCVDTTMGFTPAGGLAMGTRSGDLDPGILVYLLEEKKMPVAQVRELVYRKAGLLGVSGSTSNVEILLKQQPEEDAAADAIQLFCYQAKKYLAGLIAILGGLDTLIFTAGIGENSPEIRARICNDLGFLGIRLDDEKNNNNARLISDQDSPVEVRVMKTDEELMIARHTRALIQ